ncbi:MAG: hypothetical protein ACK5LC_06605 [Coprobacillaceae bacterium]
MQVYIIRGYYDMERQELIRDGRLLIVTPERGRELIAAGVAIEMQMLNNY